MQDSNIPAKFAIPFANGAGAGYIRTVPQASQVSVQNGAASLTDGFPPNCFMPIAAGGSWPFGQDFNGLLNQATAWARWQAAGGPIVYDAAFATAIGGYPKGAVLSSATPGNLWLNTIDNNSTNPDTGGAGWQPLVQPGSATPNMDSTASVGSSLLFARQDHTHPAAAGSATPTTNNSSATPGSSLLFARQDHVHPTNFAAFNAAPSRVANTVYTNTTGRPMFVTVDFFSTGASNLAFYINGNTSSQLQFPSGGENATLYGMVPPGNTYEFIVLSYAGTVSGWAEVY